MNISIVGFAHGHYGAYCRQWAAHPELDIIPTKGWDHDTARLTQNAQNLKLDAVESLDDLVKDTSIDAFLITAETSLHADLVEAIAPTRKPIALQKPMALTIKEADRIIIMNDGKIEDIGNHEELLKRNEVYRDLYNTQMEGALE